MGLGDEVELAIFVREAGRVVAGISGWTWGDCCELQSLWVDPRLGVAARRLGSWPPPRPRRRRVGAHRPCTSPTTFRRGASTSAAGYELVGRVEDFPSGADVLWYRKRLSPTGVPPSRRVIDRGGGSSLVRRPSPSQLAADVRTPIKHLVGPDVRGVRGAPDDDLATASAPRPSGARSTRSVRPGDVVLDVGAGSGILSVFAARAGAARVYAVEQTSVAVLAQELAAANGVAEIVRVIQGDVTDVELPERVDVIVSEWLGGFGIDEGMLVPVITARDRWLKPGGVMIPDSVTAWAALVHDRYLAETVGFLRDNPYGLDLGDLVEKTVNEISYSGGFRHLAAGDRRSEPCSAVDDGRRI